MNYEYFLRELEYLLSDLADDERDEVLRYYHDLFEEAGPEKEEEILRHLGSPSKVAEEIREGLRSGAEDGEFTEQGYRDAHYGKYFHMPDQYAQPDVRDFDGKKQKSERRRNGILLFVLFAVFGLPLAGTIISAGFSLVFGLIGGIVGILVGLLGLIFGGFATALGLLVSGILIVIVGICNLTAPAMGLMLMCVGFLILAASMVIIIAAKWGCTTVLPGICRFCVDMIRRLCGGIWRLCRRIFGRGGVAA